MAPMIGKPRQTLRVPMPKSEIPATFINLEFQISESHGKADDEDYAASRGSTTYKKGDETRQFLSKLGWTKGTIEEAITHYTQLEEENK